MIIQTFLVVGLLLCLFYAFLHRGRSRLIGFLMTSVSLAGIYFVVWPEHTTEIARHLGVGRGADLVLYCWLVISLIVSLNLRFKILALESAVTRLARELALRAPTEPQE